MSLNLSVGEIEAFVHFVYFILHSNSSIPRMLSSFLWAATWQAHEPFYNALFQRFPTNPQEKEEKNFRKIAPGSYARHASTEKKRENAAKILKFKLKTRTYGNVFFISNEESTFHPGEYSPRFPPPSSPHGIFFGFANGYCRRLSVILKAIGRKTLLLSMFPPSGAMWSRWSGVEAVETWAAWEHR